MKSPPPGGWADGRRRRPHPCFFPLSHSSHYPARTCPTPVYKSRMYTALFLRLSFFVHVSAIRGVFGLFLKDLYIISRRQECSVAQARLVHRDRPPESTPFGPFLPLIPPRATTPQTSTPTDDSHPPINIKGVLIPERPPKNHRTRQRRICASPARRRRKRSLAMLFFSREDSW